MRWFVLLFLVVGCRSGTTAGAHEHAAVQVELERGIDLVEQGDLAAGIAALRTVRPVRLRGP